MTAVHWHAPIGAAFSRRSTPAFAAGGLGWEPDPRDPSKGWIEIPFAGWVCFHCAERFLPTPRGRRLAQLHFGSDPFRLPRCRRDPAVLPLEGC